MTLHPRSFAPVPSLQHEVYPGDPGAGWPLVVLIGDSGIWCNVGNIRKRVEFSSRHTEMIVINGGVSFRVMVKVVLNLVTFCRRSIEVFHKHLTRLVMTLHI